MIFWDFNNHLDKSKRSHCLLASTLYQVKCMVVDGNLLSPGSLSLLACWDLAWFCVTPSFAGKVAVFSSVWRALAVTGRVPSTTPIPQTSQKTSGEHNMVELKVKSPCGTRTNFELLKVGITWDVYACTYREK